ncbi:MAG: segregation and condensation protein A [Glaciecola sp.]|jgi:segregation and condensation protein A
MTYQVHLSVFEGPFDLLLHLIAKRRVDVMEVDLHDITADFLSSLDQIGDLDLETATRFLVVAATLIELKAARLLPEEETDELDELLADARDLLYARLLEYRAFRQVAGIIRDRLAANAGYFVREVTIEPEFAKLVPDVALPVDAIGLARLAAVAMEPKPVEMVDLSHLRRSTLTIRDAAAQLLGIIPLIGASTTFGMMAGRRPRHERVVLFLAMLELYKLGQLDLDQPDLRGPLMLKRTDEGGDLAVLVDDYAAPEPDAEDLAIAAEIVDAADLEQLK